MFWILGFFYTVQAYDLNNFKWNIIVQQVIIIIIVCISSNICKKYNPFGIGNKSRSYLIGNYEWFIFRKWFFCIQLILFINPFFTYGIENRNKNL